MTREERIAERFLKDEERGRLIKLDPTLKLLGEWTEKGCPIVPRPRGSKNKSKATAEKAAASSNGLLAALEFVSVAATKDAEAYQAHVRLGSGYAVAYDGQISAGHPITEELECCPHFGQLATALRKCGDAVTIAQTDTGRLSIKGERLRVLVPCYDSDALPPVAADANAYPAGEALQRALAVCGTLASEAAETVVAASLLLEANQCTGTNRVALIQYWHGIDLPPGLVLPKIFAAAIAKVKAPPIGFGFTWNGERATSFTLWFEGGAWIKTQCYNDEWPSIAEIIDHEAFPIAPPEGLFEAVETVGMFTEKGFVYFRDGLAGTQHGDVEFTVPGLQAGMAIDANQLKLVTPLIQTIDLTTYENRAFFFGENLRGVIMGLENDGNA